MIRSIVAVAALAALACVGCSFPEVDFSATGGEGGLPDGSAGDAQGDARAQDGSPEADGGDGGKKDAAPDPCDFDGDNYKAADAGVCSANIDASDLDCDDHDKDRNPGVTMFSTTPTTNGDWDCNKTVEKHFPINVNCGGILAQAACNVAIGFSGDPACGASASYVTCLWNLVAIPPLCSVGSTVSQTQGCR